MAQNNAIRLFEPRGVRYSGGEYHDEEFGYRMLRPETVLPGEVYPLVLFLHGAGERGVDNAVADQVLAHLDGGGGKSPAVSLLS